MATDAVALQRLQRVWSDRYNEKDRRRILRTRRFELFAYFFGEAAGLAASFFAPLPAFNSTSVADMV
jgi:hypothetical protein